MDAEAEQEFTDFVVERTHALFRVAYALTGQQQAAEDLLQGALTKAAMRWSRISVNAEAYVRRIMYHDHISIWRRMSRRRESPVAILPDCGVSDATSETVLRLTLRQAVLSLPPRQRAVVVLRYLEDLSEREVADMLGCSQGTVASQASRALARLRTAIGAQNTAAQPGWAQEVMSA
jgi:RNA polymerase sigma-70 factor (sigma-E family)